MTNINLPNVLPIVPIRNRVLLPGLPIRLQIGRKDTVLLMQKIYKTADNKESKNLIGCVPVKPTTSKSNPDENIPSPDSLGSLESVSPKKAIEQTFDQSNRSSDLHNYGCAARIIRLERTVRGGFTAVVEGM